MLFFPLVLTCWPWNGTQPPANMHAAVEKTKHFIVTMLVQMELQHMLCIIPCHFLQVNTRWII
jgi:hypothetical protein